MLKVLELLKLWGLLWGCSLTWIRRDLRNDSAPVNKRFRPFFENLFPLSGSIRRLPVLFFFRLSPLLQLIQTSLEFLNCMLPLLVRRMHATSGHLEASMAQQGL